MLLEVLQSRVTDKYLVSLENLITTASLLHMAAFLFTLGFRTSQLLTDLMQLLHSGFLLATHNYRLHQQQQTQLRYYQVTLTQPKQIPDINVSVADLRPSSGLTSSLGSK